MRELIFSAKTRPRTDVVQRGLLAVLFFSFVSMASSAKSFVRTQTNSRYAETRVPSSEKLTRISEELELRKPSIVDCDMPKNRIRTNCVYPTLFCLERLRFWIGLKRIEADRYGDVVRCAAVRYPDGRHLRAFRTELPRG